MPLQKPYQAHNAVIVRNFGRKCKGKNAFRVLRSVSTRDEQAATLPQLYPHLIAINPIQPIQHNQPNPTQSTQSTQLT
jgi:hypothetical protein